MRRFLYLAGWLTLALLFLAPLAALFARPQLEHYALIFANENTLKAILNTLFVAFTVAGLCALIGVPLAWLLTRTDLPMKTRLRSWFCLPYAIPPYVGAIAWIILANPTSGVLNTGLGLNLNIYSFAGLIWVETTFLFTFVLLTTLSALDRMDSSLEEAARLSGAGPIRVFFDITLPLLKPSILNGFLLSFLATAASFGVPAMIGGPARIYLMTTQIFTYQRMGTEQGLNLSIVVSIFLMVMTLALLFLSQRLSRDNSTALVGGKTARPSVIRLRSWRIPVFVSLLSLLFTILILPMLALLLSALSLSQGAWSIDNLGFANFQRVLFETDETSRALAQSFGLGLAAAVICAAGAFLFGYFTVRTRWRGHKAFAILAAVPFSTPGTVLSLAFVLAFSQGFFGVGPSLYNTLWLILLAYVVKYFSLSLKTMQDGFAQIHLSLEEAARTSGATWWQTLWTIDLPLLKPALIASGFFVFMPAISELTMTILLTGPGLETVGTLIFQLQEYSDVGGGAAAVLSVVVVGLTITLNYSLRTLSKGRYGL
jgi:iron(III) transport system permease protein